MKKILVSLMLLVMTALSAHAQFEKEVWYVNASLTGLDLSHSKNEGTNFGFALTGGAFVADNVAVLLNFKGNYVEHGMDETSIGAQGRYYFSSCGIYGYGPATDRSLDRSPAFAVSPHQHPTRPLRPSV